MIRYDTILHTRMCVVTALVAPECLVSSDYIVSSVHYGPVDCGPPCILCLISPLFDVVYPFCSPSPPPVSSRPLHLRSQPTPRSSHPMAILPNKSGLDRYQQSSYFWNMYGPPNPFIGSPPSPLTLLPPPSSTLSTFPDKL